MTRERQTVLLLCIYTVTTTFIYIYSYLHVEVRVLYMNEKAVVRRAVRVRQDKNNSRKNKIKIYKKVNNEKKSDHCSISASPLVVNIYIIYIHSTSAYTHRTTM